MIDDEKWRGSQAASRCALQNPNSTLKEIISHNVLFCDRCRDEQILHKTKGEEILFPNKPPYWVLKSTDKKPENESRIEDPKKQANKRDGSDLKLPAEDRNRKNVQSQSGTGRRSCPLEDENNQDNTGVHRKSREGKHSGINAKNGNGNRRAEFQKTNQRNKKESKESNLPSNLQIHRLTKQGLSKGDALEKFVEQKRERALPKSDDNKVQIERENMPWAPSYPKALRNFHSVIQKSIDHQRYVAIVANFLNANNPQPRFQHNKQEIQVMDEKLKEERERYQHLVLNVLCSRKKSMYICQNQQAITYILNRLTTRASTIHCSYGTPIYNMEMTDLAADTLTFLTKKIVLRRGKVPKIILPNERRRFKFKCSVSDISTQFPSSNMTKFPIENDELALHLAVRYGVRVVMCASSALKILCNPWIADFSVSLIPVTVKRSFSEKTNRFENVCLVGKPCVEDSINGPSVWRRFLKFAVKLALQSDIKQQADGKAPARTGGRQRAVHRVNQNSVTLKNTETDDENSVEKMRSNVNNKNSKTSDASLPSCSNPTSALDDILGDIMGGMGGGNDIENVHVERVFPTFSGADLNKRYTLFTLGHDGMQDVDIIIRSNNDGLDRTGNELAVVHKIEFAPEFGAEKLDEEEFLHDYFSCKLKGASQLVRLRIHHTESYLLQKECYNENMLTTNKPDLRKLVEKRTQWLKNIAIKLESLEPGNYLIRKEANRLQILPEVNDSNSAYLKEEQIKTIHFDQLLPQIKETFRGIDEHLVLVYHIVQKRIPASFGSKKESSNARNWKNQHPGASSGGLPRIQQVEEDVFGNPVPEDIRISRKNMPKRKIRKRGKRVRRQRKSHSQSKSPCALKRPKFTDFDAPC